jgi:hypothetical protein
VCLFQFAQCCLTLGAVNVDDEQSARLTTGEANVQIITWAPPRLDAVKIGRGIVHAAATSRLLAALLTWKDRQVALAVTNGVRVK